MESTSRTKKRKRSKAKRKPPIPRDLPPELIKEVLARLPAKSLLKFRSVSRSWCSLIDSPQFYYKHLELQNQASRKNRLLAHEYNKDTGYVVTVRRGDTFRKLAQVGAYAAKYVIVQTCNGLTLIKSDVYDQHLNPMLLLWNACIKKMLILPGCPLSHTVDISYFLGFVPSSNDFKVLAYADRGDSTDEVEIAVYSLNDHHWKISFLPKNIYDCGSACLVTGNVVFSGGAIYWFGCTCDRGEGQVKVDRRNQIFSFDFEAENFRAVQLPDAVKECGVRFIFPLGESIAVFTMSYEISRIWAMEKRDGRGRGEDTWKLWFTGQPSDDALELLTYVTAPSSLSKFLFVQKYNNFLMTERITPDQREPQERLMSYNYISQEIKHLGQTIRGKISFDSYVESLVLQKGFEGRMSVFSPRLMRQLGKVLIA